MKHANPVVTFRVAAPMMYNGQQYASEDRIELHSVLEAPLIETLLASETIAPLTGEGA
jgi:hypothetical protein